MCRRKVQRITQNIYRDAPYSTGAFQPFVLVFKPTRSILAALGQTISVGCRSVPVFLPMSKWILPMIKYVYKADNAYGDERRGIIAAPSVSDARRLLREKGLVSTFLEDAVTYKRKRRVRKRRQKIILWTGAILIVGALAASVSMTIMSNRETAPDVAVLQQSGVLRGNAGNIVADSDETKDFAYRIIEAWNSFAPRIITGIEVRRNLMILYVSGTKTGIDANDLEVLATNSLRSLQREFDAIGVTMLIIEDDLTIMELKFNPYSGTMKIHDYR